MSGAGTFLKRLYQMEAVVAASAYGVLAVTVLADVVFREILSSPVLGTQRFAVYMSIIAGFLGVGLASAAGLHMRPRVADNWFPAAWNPGINRVSNLVTSAIFVVAGYYAVLFWHTGFEMGDTAPLLDWLLWPIQIVIPYAFFSTALRYLLFALFPNLNPADEEEK
ncbi:MAG: TRAP transporter small permease [Deltaproteobacteria bacterium]|jgi:TRAP-type C4-dicarboxylate transport system permease small subunit|nr:TRAP transporter small permease [Deltaproteobacteria bacterium]MBT4637637.1 TRAP transporter small permease [Deltaproteobacteria bacterium]MBT6502631.1 TRAP transporter small permease [Deltaproteobacteria bacterium]MBT7152480.1 TRAP transporter small permease [Deltaproteobacteria bacterium]MBT7711288.1 TRAP transporter small permease [Deltaproteobacteria bacterium]